GKLVEWFSIPSMYDLRGQDYGEIIVFLMLGAIAATILVLASRIDRASAARAISNRLLLFLVGLSFFGLVVDMAHSFASAFFALSNRGNRYFAAFEDGGEMIVVSLALWFVYRVYLSIKSPRSSRE
ncbi:MAG: hypothetical protein WBA76_03985, partial [Phormidesmis sp.]